ncbi:MAG: hypothetical protein AB1805_15290 [Nitrospirota bacterium]
MLIQGIALVLMLVSFPLISFGATGEAPWLWRAGLVALAIGGLIPAALRFFESAD